MENGIKEAEGGGRAVIGGGGKASGDGRPGFDVGEKAGAENEVDEGKSEAEVAGAGGGDGEEAEGVGVKAVELVGGAKAANDGEGTGEGGRGGLVGELGEETTERDGSGEVSAPEVSGVGFVGFVLAEEREELGFRDVVVVGGGGDGNGGRGGGIEGFEGGG